jgi:hypothetical protein
MRDAGPVISVQTSPIWGVLTLGSCEGHLLFSVGIMVWGSV